MPRALLVTLSVAAVVLAFSQPAFAQTGDEFVQARSAEQDGMPITSNLDDPWDATRPSLADPALAPTPKESMEPPLTPTHVPFMPGVDGRYVEPWNDPAMPYTQPMVVSRPARWACLAADFRICSAKIQS
jgi:hypothetical protein